MDITELLGFSVKQGASDLHITAGMPPLIRVDGDMRKISVPPMDHKEVHALIYEIMTDKQRKDYEQFMETTFRSRCQASPASVSTPSTRTAAPQQYSGPFRPRCCRWSSWAWARCSNRCPTWHAAWWW
jgi:hypothetical protein